MDEEWKCLVYHNKTFNDFEVSNTGKLRNVRTGTEYKTYKNKQGYYQVCVSLGSRCDKQIFKIHRAVAETFIPYEEGKHHVNHKDGNKLNILEKIIYQEIKSLVVRHWQESLMSVVLLLD